MIARCQSVVLAWLIKRDAIKETDKELYEYALSSLIFSFVAPLLLCAIIGSLIGTVKQSIVLILPFLFLRKFSGGYHAKRAWVCLILSGCILIFCFFIAIHIKCSIGLDFLCTISAISLGVWSPIDCENRKLEFGEKKCYKKIAIFIACGFTAWYFVLRLKQTDNYAVFIAVGIILSAGVQIPCIPKLMKSD